MSQPAALASIGSGRANRTGVRAGATNARKAVRSHFRCGARIAASAGSIDGHQLRQDVGCSSASMDSIRGNSVSSSESCGSASDKSLEVSTLRRASAIHRSRLPSGFAKAASRGPWARRCGPGFQLLRVSWSGCQPNDRVQLPELGVFGAWPNDTKEAGWYQWRRLWEYRVP
jgi:hypothetical protein